MDVPFFRVELNDTEIEEVVDTLRSGWLTTGPRVQRFEHDFADFVGSKFAVGVNSCTAALHLALEATGVQCGDLVLVPTMTFAATAEVVRYFDAVPVFVDCDNTLSIDPAELERTLAALAAGDPVNGLEPPYGPVRAVIPVHYAGYCCDMETILEIADKHDVAVIEDAAHAVPSRLKLQSGKWRHAGCFGKVGTFSFYPNKCITTGEGGMAVTDDPEIADRMRVMSLHGMNHDAWKRYQKSGSWYYEIIAPGFKYNLTDMAAALGIGQLDHADETRLLREKVAERFNEAFSDTVSIQLPANDPATRLHSWHLYSIRLNLDTLRIDRNEFITKLTERGIRSSVHWMPLHLHPYYRERYGYDEGLFPVSEAQWPRLISLPIFPAMRDDEVNYVIESVLKLTRDYAR